MPQDVTLNPHSSRKIKFGLSVIVPDHLVGYMVPQQHVVALEKIQVRCDQLIESSECFELCATVLNLTPRIIEMSKNQSISRLIFHRIEKPNVSELNLEDMCENLHI